ncbi:hypothetical protein [Nocardioides daejeonensis]|uniref:hypothetical protein n=1 Tax=Nocardioides daejeonensis TaxID=1046556 RepID=UPI000D7481B2|nr:hypothetical protein [Nocardioides daejeonensis]
MPRPSREALLVWGLPSALAALVLAPLLLGRGYALVGDMVFLPDQPWKPRWIGADGSVPRAVPTDAVTWALGTVLPGELVQRAVLFLSLVLAGAGTALLTRGRSIPARSAAVVLATWNPFVYERLAIGHWALLVGYAMLPWLVVGAARLRAGQYGGWRSVLWPLAVAAGASPTGGVLAALTLVILLIGSPRRLAAAVAMALLVNLPWLVPGVVNATAAPADPFGVQAFAARADTPWGVLGSVLSLGGIWKESVAAPGRDTVLLGGLALALSVAALAGLLHQVRRAVAPAVPLAALAALGLALALLPTTGVGERIAEWAVTDLPGGGLLRDSQKWVALAVPGLCWGLAAAADELAAWVRRRDGQPLPLLVAGALLPVLLLPSLGWGLGGLLTPHPYPTEWSQVRTTLERAGADQARTVVLPFGLYRRFDWNGGHAVLDPLPRYLPGDVVTDDALEVRDGTVAGEDPLAARIRAVKDDPERLTLLLRGAGVRWVVAHADQGVVDAPLPAGETMHSGDRLVVVDLGAEIDDGHGPRHLGRWIALDIGVLVAVLAMMLPIRRLRGYSRPRE